AKFSKPTSITTPPDSEEGSYSVETRKGRRIGQEKGLNDYKITESARAIQEYTDKLSNWYVRRSRERYWGKDMTSDKAAAYTTLYTALTTLAKLIAPFTPFMAESIYQNLVKNFDKEAQISVHLTDYPVADMSYVDATLEKEMEYIIDVVVLGRACRNKAAIKNRQPLSTVYVKSGYKPALNGITSIAADELNVKEFKLIEEDNELVNYEIKPQLKTLGPKYGSMLGVIRNYLSSCDTKALVRAVANGGVYNTVIGDKEIELTEADLLISTVSKVGFVTDSNGAITVVLDTNLTNDLIEEGIAREIVSKIQTMRKEADFEVTDHIRVGLKCSEKTLEIVKRGDVCSDVLCDILDDNATRGYPKEWDINGEQLTIAIERL
ncbi:MAG: isoleucine--tRNA ligase, partial [Clostridia bacterium]|nr:isoleucine--tRNA ligase [Clostridia bacterium]